MISWRDFHQAFESLESSELDIQLELIFGDGAEEWTAHSEHEDIKRQFLNLCGQAGELLPAIHLTNHETGSPVMPEVRWFRLLRERNNPHMSSPLLVDQAGVALSQWLLESPIQRSIRLCSELERSNPIQKSEGWFLTKIRQDPIGSGVAGFGALLLVIILIRIVAK